MFGYVKPQHSELLVREYEFYRAAYCGVCRRMKKETGRVSSLSLSYDIVFLALCRMLLGQRQVTCRKCRCIAHPFKKRQCLQENEALSYAARVSALLSREKLRDDMHDSGFFKKIGIGIIFPFFASAGRRAKLPVLAEQMQAHLADLAAIEKEQTPSIDQAAQTFGALLADVFAYEVEQEHREIFYKVGLHLGRFIYAADAAEDYAEDVRSGNYNPFVYLYGKTWTENDRQSVKTGLYLELKALSEAVEQLPFGTAAATENIIKNIIYLGLPDRIRFLDQAPIQKGTDHD